VDLLASQREAEDIRKAQTEVADLERQLKEALQKISVLETRSLMADATQGSREMPQEEQDKISDNPRLSSITSKQKSIIVSKIEALETETRDLDKEIKAELIEARSNIRDLERRLEIEESQRSKAIESLEIAQNTIRGLERKVNLLKSFEASQRFNTTIMAEESADEKIGRLKKKMESELEEKEEELSFAQGRISALEIQLNEMKASAKANLDVALSQLKIKDSALRRKDEEITKLRKLLQEQGSLEGTVIPAPIEGIEQNRDITSELDIGNNASRPTSLATAVSSNDTKDTDDSPRHAALSISSPSAPGGTPSSKRHSMPSSADTTVLVELKTRIELVESQLKMKESTLKQKENQFLALQETLREKESIIKNSLGDTDRDYVHKAAELERELKETQIKIKTLEVSNNELKNREADLQKAAIIGNLEDVKGSKTNEKHGVEVAKPAKRHEIKGVEQKIKGENDAKTMDLATSDLTVSVQHDMSEEIGFLQMQLKDMMEQTESLANDVEQKDVALKHAEMHLMRLRRDNVRLRSAVETIGNTTKQELLDVGQEEDSVDFLNWKLRSAQKELAANKLLVESMRDELNSEKNHREELEVLVSEQDSDSDAHLSSSRSSSASTKSESIVIDDFQGGQIPSRIPIVRSKTREVGVIKDSSEEGEAEKRSKFEPKEGKGLAGGEPCLDFEITELQHATQKKEEVIEMLRTKLREQEELISLLNKTLSEKDVKIKRLEMLLGEVHGNVTISEELEENELTIDSLVMIRNDNQKEIGKLKQKIRDLEGKLVEFEEFKYQLRRRTEEIAEQKTKIETLKAELEDESKRVRELMDDQKKHFDHARVEKLHLKLDAEDQSRKFETKLREKEEFIKSIHFEAAERGLLVESLDASLQDTNKRLKQMESEIWDQAETISSLTKKLQQAESDKSSWIQERKERDDLIRMLNKVRLDGEKTIAELTKPKPETNRQKVLRRYKQMQAEERRVSGLESYMEPFVLDLQEAQVEFERARKNLRLAQARERLVRPRA